MAPRRLHFPFGAAFTSTGKSFHMANKRHFIRHDAVHLIDYLVVDQAGHPSTHSMGRTLDVSKNGLKLETTQALHPGEKLQLTVGLANDLIDLTGQVIHCKTHRGRYVAGVTFSPVDKNTGRILNLYVNAFNTRKQKPKAS